MENIELKLDLANKEVELNSEKNSLKYCVLFFFMIVVFGCKKSNNKQENTFEVLGGQKPKDVAIATAFDFPVGKPDAKGYYNAQVFGENNHLGDDWNGVKGGNTDLGDAIYAIANGYVVEAKDYGGGWGNVIRIVHTLPSKKQVESIYAHCDSILISKGDVVLLGQKIATIGTANGNYLAHLHLEIRNKVGMPIGGGYSLDTSGYEDPTKFINSHRILN